MPDTTSRSSGNYLLLTRLADEFAARYRAGERPSLQEYIDRHPDLADDIRELLPAMVEIEQVKEDRQEAAEQVAAAAGPGAWSVSATSGSSARSARGAWALSTRPSRFPWAATSRSRSCPGHAARRQARRRFEREAKSAARLHHTNIVPVFGVGEQDGLPYYVMQFIQGLGLDAVLEELKKLQPGAAGTGTIIGVGRPVSWNGSRSATCPTAI